MKLTRCIPMATGDTVFDGLNLSFPSLDRFFGEFDRSVDTDGRAALRLPRTNISEKDNTFVLTVEMPGISREDVDIRVEGDRLLIKGGTEATTEDKESNRSEYRAMRYERSFTVGNDIDAAKITAKMENGVLAVTLPKSEEKVGRTVKIS